MTYTPSKFPPAAQVNHDGTLAASGLGVATTPVTINGSGSTLFTGWGTTTLTCQKAGWYTITAHMHLTTSAGTNQWAISIRKGGVAQVTSSQRQLQTDAERTCTLRIQLAVSDTIDVTSNLAGGSAPALTIDGDFWSSFTPIAAFPQ